jgi:hypothetical protein
VNGVKNYRLNPRKKEEVRQGGKSSIEMIVFDARSREVRDPLALTRISHLPSTAAADPGTPPALRSIGRLDALSSTPAVPLGRAPCIHARLRRLAMQSVEKSGLNTISYEEFVLLI